MYKILPMALGVLFLFAGLAFGQAGVTSPPLLAALETSTAVILGIVIGAGLVFLFMWLRHRWTRSRVTARFEEFKDKVMELRQRVEAVQERHKLLPVSDKDFKTPMSGATLAVYNRVQEDVKRLMDGWLERMDVWDKVQLLVGTEKFLRVGHLKEADRLLDQIGDFEEVDKSCGKCVESLDKLERGHEQARAMRQRAEERPAQVKQQIDAIRVLPLPTAPYEAELDRCVAAIADGSTSVESDPLGAQATFEGAQEKMDGLCRWMEDISSLFQRAPKALDELEKTRRQAADRRSQGLRLCEPDGNPDPLLEQGRNHHREVLQALERADNKGAGQHLEQAFSLARQAGERIERQAAARALCQREMPARRGEVQRLHQAAGEAQSARAELERSFAPESWSTVADNLTRVRELQTTSETGLEEAASAATDQVQHYFRAADLLKQVQQQQEQAQGMLQAVGQTLQKLTEVRQGCYHRSQDVAEQARRVQSFFGMNHSVVCQPARSKFDGAEAKWRQVRGQMDAGRPNWPAVQQQLDEARQGYIAALKDAEEDVRCHQQLTVKLGEAGREAARIDQFLRQHWADRAPANNAYRAAADTLEQARQAVAGRNADWKVLLGKVEEAANQLKKAEQLAREDLALSDRAEAEIAEAEREVERAQGFYQLNITATVGPADSRLAQARVHLSQQAYEKAIEEAKAAQQAARAAHDDAVRRAQQEQQRQDQEQRQREMAAAAAAAPAAWAAANVVANPLPTSSSAPAPAPEPGGMNFANMTEVPASPPLEPAAAEEPAEDTAGEWTQSTS